MAAPCTDHLFLTGRRGVGKSTLLRCLLEGKRPGGFFTLRVEGVFDRPSIHLLRASSKERPAPENLVCFCGEQRPERFDLLGVEALADTADCQVIVMDELGPAEAAAQRFQAAVLAALDGEKPVYGVLQQADSPFLQRIAARDYVTVAGVTRENRDRLPQLLLEQFHF